MCPSRLVLYSWSAFCRNTHTLAEAVPLPLIQTLRSPSSSNYLLCCNYQSSSYCHPCLTISAATYQTSRSELLRLARVVEFDTTSSIQSKLLCWDIQLYCQFLQPKPGILPWVRGGVSGHQALPT